MSVLLPVPNLRGVCAGDQACMLACELRALRCIKPGGGAPRCCSVKFDAPPLPPLQTTGALPQIAVAAARTAPMAPHPASPIFLPILHANPETHTHN